MHDCEHENDIVSEDVEDSIGKAMRKTTPDFAFNFSPALRGVGNALESLFNLDGKSRSEASLAFFVICRRRKILRARLGVELNAH
jgi:hypothetical protein